MKIRHLLAALAMAMVPVSTLEAEGPSPLHIDGPDRTETESEGEGEESERPFTYRDVQVALEGQDEGGLDLSRFRVETNWLWTVGKGAEITLRAPYQSISTSQTGGPDADVDGLKDFQLTYYTAPQNDGRGKQTRWEVWFNLPVGKEGLNAEESRAIQRIRAGSASFFGPQPSIDFGVGVGRHWNLVKGNQRDDFTLKLRFMSDYDLSNFTGTVIRNEGRDNLEASWTRTKTLENIEHQFGIRFLLFDDSATITNGVRSNFDSSTNVHAWYQGTRKLNERNLVKYRAYYQNRGSLDSFNQGLAANQNSELGDRWLWNLIWNRKVSDGASWNFGFNGLWSDSTSVAGANVAGSRRDENYGHVGYSRTSNSGRGWSINGDIGLSSDALDHRLLFRWFRQL